jgi:hypothetical protein
MKKTLIMLSVLALLIAAFCTVPETGVSNVSKTGTVKVCWSQVCIANVQDSKVQLVNKYGVIVGTCEIVPPNTCCKIQGDFPSGYYHFIYYQSGSTTRCKTPEFYYNNGTDVTYSVVCVCP